MGTLTVILQLILSLSLLVIVHEFGHFLFARLFKIRVEKFRIFFDPWRTLFKFKPKNSDTEYGIGWLPLGGYVKIAGMIDESLDTDQMKSEPQPWEFRTHPAWQRLLVMFGGVLFNVLLAFVIYSGVAYVWGKTYLPISEVKTGMQFSPVAHQAGFEDGDILLRADDQQLLSFDEDAFTKVLDAKTVTVQRNGVEKTIQMPEKFTQNLIAENKGFASYRFPFVVDSVMPSSPASAALLQKEDEVVAINGQRMFMDEVRTTFHNNPNIAVTLTVARGNDTLNLKITPNEQGLVGVMMKGVAQLYKLESERYGLLESVPVGIGNAVHKLTSYVHSMKYVFTPEGAQSLGGFGAIAQLYPSSFDWHTFWYMTGFLSVILAVMNLLPIPGLDGGHILFVLFEIVTRRKPSQEFLIRAQTIGMVFLLMLALYANLNDLFRFLK